MSPEQQQRARDRELVNGCGPRAGLLNYLVPDSLFGMCLTSACEEHDWDYEVGGDSRAHSEADSKLRRSQLAEGKRLRKSWGISPSRLLARAYMRPWHFAVAWTYWCAVRTVTLLGLAGESNWPDRPARTRKECFDLVDPRWCCPDAYTNDIQPE